jgi:ABC-2 type transport system permease protein
MTALVRLTLVELKLFVRDPAAAFFTLLLPLILLVLNANPTPAVEERLPGLCVLVLATAGIMWLPEVIASYRERGILRRQRLAPIGPLVIVAAHTNVQVLVAGAGIALLGVVGVALAGYPAPADPAAATAGVLLATTSVCALGFALASVARTARATAAIASALYFPAIFLSGATWPRDGLPPVARAIGDVFPLTYAVEVVRRPWIDGGLPLAETLVLLALVGLAAPAVAATFRWR